MRILASKVQIIKRIKEYYGFKSNGELATFLGVAPNTISGWVKRNTMDYDLVFSKCSEIPLDQLLWEEKEIVKSNEKINEYLTDFEGMESLYNYFIKKYHYVTKSKKSTNIYLTLNDIYNLASNYLIYPQFNRLYDKLKTENNINQLLPTKIIDLIKEDEKIMSVLMQYEDVFNELEEKLLDFLGMYSLVDSMPNMDD